MRTAYSCASPAHAWLGRQGQRPPLASSATRGWHVVAEPKARTNSFVGTEEYLAPEVITGVGHGASSHPPCTSASMQSVWRAHIA